MLFETNDADRHALGGFFAGEGGHAWTQLRLDSFSPYFQVVAKSTCRPLMETVLIGNVDTLMDYLSGLKGQGAQVLLVSPWYLNKSRHWKIEPLAEIWEGCSPDSPATLFVKYVLGNDREYLHCLDGPQLEINGIQWRQRL